MKEWIYKIDLLKEKFISIFIRIKLYGFDFKYWGVVSLSKIGSILGKLMFVDENI